MAESDTEFSMIVLFVEGLFRDRRLGLVVARGAQPGRRIDRRRRGRALCCCCGGKRLLRARRRHVDLRRVLAVGAGIGRFEIDDVAQQNLAVVQFVAPDDDGLEGQRAFAEPGDHRLAAGLDALGDGDFALARQQLDRAHLAQIHAHGIVGAVGRLGGARRRPPSAG